MKKTAQYTLTAALAITLCTCMSETILTDVNDSRQPICFSSSAVVPTKTVRTGEIAARDLGYSYIVTGYAYNSIDTTLVFDHYKVNYLTSSAGSSSTNYAGWEYVGQTPDQLSRATRQEIKYWDTHYNYYFVAFSKGEGNARFTRVVNTTINNGNNSNPSAQNSAFSISGRITDIEGAYYADLLDVKGSEMPVVAPQFKHLGAKIRLAMYETVPGYSVTDVKFYSDNSSALANNGSELTPMLFQSEAIFPADTATGIVYVAYPSISNRTAAISNPSVNARTKYLSFNGGLDYVTRENKETINDSVYLGRSSATASYSVIAIDVPAASNNPLPIHIKVDYTLVPTDGASERIHVSGATASVPAAYTNWVSNSMYTYIFKISDQTGGSTGGGISGLYPISFDALNIGGFDGQSQQTVNIIPETSIVAHQNHSETTSSGDIMYNAGNIYIAVYDSLENVVLYPNAGSNKNISLFVAKPGEDATAGDITEAVASDCLNSDNPYGPYEFQTGKTISLTCVDQLLTSVSQIPAADSPTDADLNINAAVFNADNGNTYVIQYRNIEGGYSYKVLHTKPDTFIRFTAYYENTEESMELFFENFDYNFSEGAYFKDCNGKILTINRQKTEDSTTIDTDGNIVGKIFIKGDVAEIFAVFVCANLVSIDLPESLTTIADSDPDGDEDELGAFAWNDYLSDISIPGNVSRIGNNAFNYSTIQSITLNEGVETIGKKAFCDCIIGDLIFPNSMLEVEDYAFTSIYATTSISNLSLNSGLTTIGNYSFGSEESQTEIGTLVLNGVPSDISTTAFKNAQIGKLVLNSLDITNINDFNFDDSSIDTLTFCEGYKTIDEGAFNKCKALDHVVLPSSTTTLKNSAFNSCNMSSLFLNEGITSIGNYACNGCSNLTTITIPSSVKSWGQHTFSGTGIETLNLTPGLTSIGRNAFSSCPLTEVIIPASVTSIKENAFDGCDNLETMVFLGETPPENLEYFMQERAFGIHLYIYVPDNCYDVYRAALYDILENVNYGSLSWDIKTFSGAPNGLKSKYPDIFN